MVRFRSIVARLNHVQKTHHCR